MLALEQLGVSEFGTLRFSITEARRRITALAHLDEPDLGVRVSDFELFYQHVAHPLVLNRLFALCERARINVHIRHHYPGIKRHQDAYHRHLLMDMPDGDTVSVPGLLQCLNAALLGAKQPAFETDSLGKLLYRALGNARPG